MRLHDIHEQIEEILAAGTDPETGEITAEAMAAIDDLEWDLQSLALEIAAYEKGERCEADAVKREAKKLRERAAIHDNRADQLLAYLKENLADTVINAKHPLRDARVQITKRKSSAPVVVDADMLPDDCLRYPPPEVDRKALRAAIQLGEIDSEVAYLEERTNLKVS